MGWKWDRGYLEKWVDALVKEEEEKSKENMIVDEEMGVAVDQEIEVGEDESENKSSKKDGEKVNLL